jgi:hypothetical protein
MSQSDTSTRFSQSDNRDDYRSAFLGQVHRLLSLGYAALNPLDFAQSEEDSITGELCKHMKVLTEERPTEPWMGLYSVHDQDPVNDACDEKTGNVRKGSGRPKLDVRLVNKSRVPNSGFCIEAKRLYRSDSVSEYVNDEGLGAFVNSYYASSDSVSGMIGYVQCDSVDNWLDKLNKKIGEARGKRFRSKGIVTQISAKPKQDSVPLRKVVFFGGPEHVYHSRHARKRRLGAIDVFHTFFLFC